MDLKCTDPQNNRVLELIAIFQIIYNLTIQANAKHGDEGFEKQDHYFDELCPKVGDGAIRRRFEVA